MGATVVVGVIQFDNPVQGGFKNRQISNGVNVAQVAADPSGPGTGCPKESRHLLLLVLPQEGPELVEVARGSLAKIRSVRKRSKSIELGLAIERFTLFGPYVGNKHRSVGSVCLAAGKEQFPIVGVSFDQTIHQHKIGGGAFPYDGCIRLFGGRFSYVLKGKGNCSHSGLFHRNACGRQEHQAREKKREEESGTYMRARHISSIHSQRFIISRHAGTSISWKCLDS
jgi:hypothetical protein